MNKSVKLMSICLVSALLTAPAFAATTVHAQLWDKGDKMDLSGDVDLGMGASGDLSNATMGVKTDKTKVPAGKVTFDVTNTSKGTVHEMLVAAIGSTKDKLPFIKDQDRVDEEAIKDLGEVSELEPGKSGALTLDLKPGLYLLFCNVPGHFKAGMWTTLTVTK